MRALIDARTQRRGEVYIEEFALVPESLGCPRLRQDILGFLKPALRLRERDAVSAILIEVIRRAAPDSERRAPSAQVVEKGYLLGEPNGVVERHLHGGESDADAPSPRRDRRRERRRVDVGASAVQMMLAEPDFIEAQRLRKLRLAQSVGDRAKILARRGGLRK